MPAPAPASLIDVVDDQDRPVGTIERGRALEEGKAFRVAHVWVFREDRLLLQQLGRGRKRHPLQWGSSVAAYLHSGESYEEAAERRLHEELGLRLPLKGYVVTKMQDGQSTKFIALYLAWLPRPELPEIREPKHIEALRFWTGPDLDRTLETSPETFTETFRHLYGLYAAAGPDGTALH